MERVSEVVDIANDWLDGVRSGLLLARDTAVRVNVGVIILLMLTRLRERL